MIVWDDGGMREMDDVGNKREVLEKKRVLEMSKVESREGSSIGAEKRKVDNV